MTASPTPTASVPGDVGLPSEEEIARAIHASPVLQPAHGAWREDVMAAGQQQCLKAARAILSLIRPAFEAKDQRIRELAALLDKQMGTPCEQIRHQQEIGARDAVHLQRLTRAMRQAQDWRAAAEAAEAKFREANMQALSDEGQMRDLQANLAQAVEELSGLRQAIMDAAVICDDDEKAGDRLDKLARAIRARSASARGEK